MANPGLSRRLSQCLGQPLDAANDPLITGLALDSRQVQPGDLFLACQGSRADGLAFVPEALARGAVALVSDRQVSDLAIPQVCVPDLRRQLSAIAGRFYGEPSRQLRCIGITGTNGKTSVAWYLAQLLRALGEPAAYAGTLGWQFPDTGRGGMDYPGGLTTEDPLRVQQRLAQLAELGCRWVAMEVSSHGLDQHRVDAVAFTCAVLTNLSRDHLDDHGSMDAYQAAKARLFAMPGLKGWVINADDAALGATLLATPAPAGVQVLTYGESEGAQLRWQDLQFDAQGIQGRLLAPWGEQSFQLPLFGDFSVANLMAALGTLVLAGFDPTQVLSQCAQLQAPPGRLQNIRVPGRPQEVVDYAHTPDALQKALLALRAHGSGRLLCVFGCGGDRDPGKRPLMAAAVEACADLAWITSDNPRSEDPGVIAQQMQAGLSGRIPVQVILDRQAAIAAAIAAAAPGDLVLVAGKGHETYQEVAGRRLPFSDLAVAQALLQSAAGGGQ